MNETISLDGEWELISLGAEVPENLRSPLKITIPSSVHIALFRKGLLPDPLKGRNGEKYQWIEKSRFIFSRRFTLPASIYGEMKLKLEKVDYFARIFIDRVEIGLCSNAHHPWVFDITPCITPGREQTLTIEVDSGVSWAEKQDRSRYLPASSPERMFLRKPQYTFGWDWAPRMVSCGIPGSISIETVKAPSIEKADLSYSLAGNCAELTFTLELRLDEPEKYSLALIINGGEPQPLTERTSCGLKANCKIFYTLENTERWYPRELGEPVLYDITVLLQKENRTVDSHTFRTGFREISLIQEPYEGGKTFIISVNGRRMFIKGSNWVPAEFFMEETTDKKYRKLISEALGANMNMLRIWGGGSYEKKTFYEECDRQGILLWQDFLFACSEYPEDSGDFLKSVEKESGLALSMLKNHPSIVLWCGNNENDWIFGFYGRGGREGKQAYYYGSDISHRLLPRLMKEQSVETPYWPSSPWGGDFPNSDEEGDKHAWDVSIHYPNLLERTDYRHYRQIKARFISEYGMLSYMMPRTYRDMSGEREIRLDSDVSLFHDNLENGPLMKQALEWIFRKWPENHEDRIKLSLAYQAMGMREAIVSFRKRKPRCGGSLFWMYSDCWPAHGWTIIDYYLRRKPSYYWVKKAYQPVGAYTQCFARRTETYLINDSHEEQILEMEFQAEDMAGTLRQRICRAVSLPPDCVVEGPVVYDAKGWNYIALRKDGKILSEDLVLHTIPGDLEIAPCELSWKEEAEGRDLMVTIHTDRFAYMAEIRHPDGAEPEDNWFHVAPGIPRRIRIRRADAGTIDIKAFNSRGEYIL
ncbi:MAG: hypothetical protein JXR86_18120 [Spirochaetales bacterium]|nr:hypothetical protein [Spirochaetales bacterium]